MPYYLQQDPVFTFFQIFHMLQKQKQEAGTALLSLRSFRGANLNVNM